MRDNNIKKLLLEINSIVERYEEIAKVTGEGYNIFQVIGVSTKELVHSSMIANLLNMKGSHEHGNIFFKLFLKRLIQQDFIFESFDFKSSYTVKKEVTIDNNRRIDILIESESGYCIAIENKIYAEDQNQQVSDYYDYLKKKYKENFFLLYLTLNGGEPSNDSYGEDKEKYEKHFGVISYKQHIINWLEELLKEIVEKTLLRETIKQYIILLRRLTGQSRSKKMSEELVKTIIKSKEDFKAAYEISNNFEKAKEKVLKDFWENVNKKYTTKIVEKSISEKYWSCHFYLKEHGGNSFWKNFKITFQFYGSNLSDLRFGITRCDDKTSVKKEVINRFYSIAQKYSYENHFPNWMLMKQIDGKYRNWTIEDLGDIAEREEKKQDFKNIINKKIEELEMVLLDKLFGVIDLPDSYYTVD